MRLKASLAVGAGLVRSISTKRRRRCDQQKASVMRFARSRSWGRIGERLVSRVAIALHEAGIIIEQLERMHRAAAWRVSAGDARRI